MYCTKNEQSADVITNKKWLSLLIKIVLEDWKSNLYTGIKKMCLVLFYIVFSSLLYHPPHFVFVLTEWHFWSSKTENFLNYFDFSL